MRRPVRLWRVLARYADNDRGVALVITLFVVALVTILVLEYHFDASVEIDLAANYARDVQAYHLALSGVQFARAVLQRDDAQADGPEDFWYRLGLVPLCYPPGQLLALDDELAAGTLVLDTPDAAPETPAPAGGCVRLRITDEQGKLPLNALMPQGPNVTTWRSVFTQLFDRQQIDPDMLDALADWIDPDDVPQGIGGAENSYYEGLETPYQAANAPFRTPGELRLVRGFDAETLARLLGLSPDAMADVDLGSNAYLTPFGVDQDAKVNLNTASEDVLLVLFEGLPAGAASPPDLVEQILTQRGETQFAQMADLNNIVTDPATRTPLTQIAAVKSVYFRVESMGIVEGIRKKAVAVLHRDSQGTIKVVYFKVE